LNYDHKGVSHKIFLKVRGFEFVAYFWGVAKGSMFESIGVGDDYSDIKVLSLIIICYYRGRKKIFIFIFYMEISISIKQGEVRLG